MAIEPPDLLNKENVITFRSAARYNCDQLLLLVDNNIVILRVLDLILNPQVIFNVDCL